MRRKRRLDQKAAEEERKLEPIVRQAGAELGWTLPLTEDAVAQEEKHQEEKPIRLPRCLKDAEAAFEGQAEGRESTSGILQPKSYDFVVDHLARAAREGREITKEVEARMRKDRKVAEERLESHDP